jgi:hypothetical protein
VLGTIICRSKDYSKIVVFRSECKIYLDCGDIFCVEFDIFVFLKKNIPILDIICVAFGFVLRALSGGFIIDVDISPWLVLCALFLSLFLAIHKRKSEVQNIAVVEKNEDRCNSHTVGCRCSIVPIFIYFHNIGVSIK